MGISAIILEDEQIAVRRLVRMISEVAPDVNVLEVFESVQSTRKYLLSNEIQPDILFVDINVSDGNSFKLFNKVNVKCNIIFTTAFNEYAVSAFRVNAADFLLKPLKKEHLEEAIQRVRKSVNTSPSVDPRIKNRFVIRFGNKMQVINAEDIVYIYSKNKITYFYTKDCRRIPSDVCLQVLENQLDARLFFRANRQFIVHVDSIAKILKHDAARVKLILQPDIKVELIVSTEKTREFKKWLRG